MPHDRDSAFLLALGASIAVHVVGAGVAALVRPQYAYAAVVIAPTTVELEWVDPVHPETLEPDLQEPEPEASSEAREVAASMRRPDPVGSAASPALATDALRSDGPPSDPFAVPEQRETPEPDPAPPPFFPRNLDPRAAALGSLEVAPHQVAPQAQPVAEDPSARFRRAEAGLDRHLAARAAVRPAVSERPRPQVRPQADGSYTYDGHAFSARIDAEGRVSFSDTGSMQYAGGGGRADSVSLSFDFDVTDGAYRRRGQDPYQAERAWFMRETEAMRESLQDAARARQRVTLARQMAGRVQRVWDTVERSAEARRRQIFRLWDDCAEGDADGDAARDAILGWVRRQLPAGSESAFTPAELTTLNTRRQSSAAFAPY